jgi:hypothetical protein
MENDQKERSVHCRAETRVATRVAVSCRTTPKYHHPAVLMEVWTTSSIELLGKLIEQGFCRVDQQNIESSISG